MILFKGFFLGFVIHCFLDGLFIFLGSKKSFKKLMGLCWEEGPSCYCVKKFIFLHSSHSVLWLFFICSFKYLSVLCCLWEVLLWSYGVLLLFLRTN